jgi:hypothetical protein
MRPCFVHIGTPKTGSTSLQAFLAANRGPLREAGFVIPESAGTGDPESACHHAIVSDLLDEPARPTGDLRSVIAELAASDAPRGCISTENISLLYNRPELLGRLRDGIVASGFTPVIVAFVRPQVSYATAIFGHNVRNGDRTPFPTYVAEVLDSGAYRWKAGYGPQFDYVHLLDGFADVFGRDAIVVRPFSSDAPDGALHRAFIEVLLPRTPFGRFRVPPLRANRTMTFGALLSTLGTPNDFDEHLRFAPFGFAEIGRFQRRFDGPNRRLAERYGLRLPIFESADLIRALPVRRTPRLTRQLGAARRALLGTAVTGRSSHPRELA